MSWSSALRPFLLTVLIAGTGLALGACSSFAPVYGGTLADQPALALAYAKPRTRLEQVVYRELALRFGSSDAQTAPLATVSVQSSSAVQGLSATAAPDKLYRTTVTAQLILTRRDDTNAAPVVLTRQSSADYTISGQVLADTQAANEAAERAARAAAESLRLALLAALSR